MIVLAVDASSKSALSPLWLDGICAKSFAQRSDRELTEIIKLCQPQMIHHARRATKEPKWCAFGSFHQRCFTQIEIVRASMPFFQALFLAHSALRRWEALPRMNSYNAARKHVRSSEPSCLYLLVRNRKAMR